MNKNHIEVGFTKELSDRDMSTSISISALAGTENSYHLSKKKYQGNKHAQFEKKSPHLIHLNQIHIQEWL